MTSAPPPRTFAVRHLQLARAAFAALAAVMITFSPDHSAAVGMSVFSGVAIATGLVLVVAVWLVYPATRRWPAILLGGVTLVAGMAGGLAPLRTVAGFFIVVIAWAIVSGVIETVAGIRAVRGPRAPRPPRAGAVAPWTPPDSGAIAPAPRSEGRDAIVIGILTVVLGLALLLVNPAFSLQYTIDDVAETFTLTGITIGVGIFGGYAAIVAVYLAIAGFSPRAAADPATEGATGQPSAAGVAPENPGDPA